MNLSIDVLAAYMVAISAVSLVFVQTIKTVFINHTKLDDASRLAVIQVVNYAINFGLLLLVLALKGEFDPAQFLFYLAAPLAQVSGSSTAFNFVTGTHNKQEQTAQTAQTAPLEVESGP